MAVKIKRRKAREQGAMCRNNIHCNPAYDEHCATSADNVSASSKDSGFGKHDETLEGEMMDGEYNTLRLQFPVTKEPQDATLAVSCRSFPHCNIPLAVLCRAFPYCIEYVLYICQNGVICYICECKAEITFNSSTNGSTNVSTSATISSSTTEAEPSTRSEESISSTFLEEDKKSVPVSIAGSIGGIVLIALLTIGLVILFRKRKRRAAREHDEMRKNNIHCNPAYDEHCAPSADNVSVSSKDSGFGKHESVEGEMMDGEYNTLRLHFPVNNEPQDNTYNHIDGSLTAQATYSHIPNSKDALFDNTYSHMSDVTNGKSFKPEDKDATYNHLGDSCSSKRKGKTEESRDETYSHAQMSHVRPTADQVDQGDNYSHINLSGLKAQMQNADDHRVDAQEPTRTNAEYAKAKNVTKIVDKGKKQHGEARKGSATTAEEENNSEGHTYFVLESNTDQHSKQTPYDYQVAAAPKKDHSEFTV
ncbi:hypothetical protein MAR_018139 [Mya arenaria]|uniref:Uncharacterized protein n=1 Tax=Mya arenaria TaxID=6604 RepID=A0ABY7EHA1_MYAAR|nr:hypothetical protein MAR_018139 [Mya arenaria]